MKNTFSKLKVLAVVGMLLLSFMSSPVFAAWSSFSGAAVVGYNTVSVNVQCNDTNERTYVNWVTSNYSDVRTVFRVLSHQSGSAVGNYTFDYLQTATFRTSTEEGAYYNLQAGREYFYDPSNYITGTWIP